jgi:hypothetical protein
MGGAPDENRLAVGNKEDKEMFEKEIDEIYGLCKRVVNEVPTASVTFFLGKWIKRYILI